MKFKRIVPDSTATPTPAKQRKRRYWTEEERAALVARWEASGLSQSEFCKRHDINGKSLSRWYNRLRGQQTEQVSAKTSRTSVTVEPLSYVMSLPNGIALRVTGQLEMTMLVELLQQVARCKFS